MNNFTQVANTNESIKNKRNQIRNQLFNQSKYIQTGEIKRISDLDLKILFNLYDDVFFDGYFQKAFKSKLKFSLSTKMTRAAGKTIVPKLMTKIRREDVVFEIRIGINFFFKYLELNRDKRVCGIITKDALEALQIVFEHEICHVIEFYIFGDSNCKKQRFKALANNIFGHSGTYHELPTNREIAHEKYGFKVGDLVMFSFEGNILEGFIYGINKRATVMVPDKKGRYRDSKGKIYTKYYVPLPGLKNPYKS